MKFSHALFSFIAGIVGVLFGGVFLGLVLDKLFSGELETGDMATWSAALGTIFTLGFLINQHVQLRQSQRKESETREEHERKQQEMWAQQDQMLTFQKYKEHKQLFFDTLNELEREYDIKFFDRSGFYSNIFQANNFDSCEMKVNLNETELYANSLQDICYVFNGIKSSLESPDLYDKNKRQQHLEEHLLDLIRLSSSLHITFKGTGYLGDIYWDVPSFDKPLALNLFDSFRTTVIMQNVFFTLLKFTGNQELQGIEHLRTNFFHDALIESVHKKYYRSSFITDMKKLDNALGLLFTAYETIKVDSSRKHQRLWSHRDQISSFFYEAKNKKISLDNPDALIDILKKQASAFTLFHKEKEGVGEPFKDLLRSTEATVEYLSKGYGVTGDGAQ